MSIPVYKFTFRRLYLYLSSTWIHKKYLVYVVTRDFKLLINDSYLLRYVESAFAFFQKIKASLSLIPLFERNVFTYVYIIAITLWKFSNCKSNFRTKMVLLPQCDFQGVRKKIDFSSLQDVCTKNTRSTLPQKFKKKF